MVPASACNLKGQFHEKVGEKRPWDVSLDPAKNRYWFFIFSDRPFNFCDPSKI
jgi:hypothetical protein